MTDMNHPTDPLPPGVADGLAVIEQLQQDNAIGEAIALHSTAIDAAFTDAKNQLIGQLATIYYQRAKGVSIEVPHHVVVGDIKIVLNPMQPPETAALPLTNN